MSLSPPTPRERSAAPCAARARQKTSPEHLEAPARVPQVDDLLDFIFSEAVKRGHSYMGNSGRLPQYDIGLVPITSKTRDGLQTFAAVETVEPASYNPSCRGRVVVPIKNVAVLGHDALLERLEGVGDLVRFPVTQFEVDAVFISLGLGRGRSESVLTSRAKAAITMAWRGSAKVWLCRAMLDSRFNLGSKLASGQRSPAVARNATPLLSSMAIFLNLLTG